MAVAAVLVLTAAGTTLRLMTTATMLLGLSCSGTLKLFRKADLL